MEPEAPKPDHDSTAAESKAPARPLVDPDPPQEKPRRAAARKVPASPRVRKVIQAMAPTATGGSASSALLDGAQDGGSLLNDATANTRAMIETTNAIIRAGTVDDVVRGSLDAIRKAFGWAYASYWSVDPTEHALVFTLESGRVDDEFQRHTRSAGFAKGRGSMAAPGGNASSSLSRTSASSVIAAALRWPAAPVSNRELPCRSFATGR